MGNMIPSLKSLLNLILSEGLAHFTEHMVHYGSKNFQQQDGYVTFALAEGFGFNACTENHLTTYYNTVKLKSLEESINRMADMLSEPLFEHDMTIKEINAVDAEFHLKRHIDVVRRYFLLQTAMGKHPLGKFGFGNRETLLKSGKIHEVLRKFHSRHYCAGAMTVGVETSISLDDQERLVRTHFGRISQGRKKCFRDTLDLTADTRKTDLKSFPMDYVIQGLTSFSNLWVVWPIYVNGNEALALLAQILGSEEEGGLAHYLTKEGYVWLMLAQSPVDTVLMENKHTKFLSLDFFLTPKGLNNVTKIMQTTYAYLEYLKTTSKEKLTDIYKQLKLDRQRRTNYCVVNGLIQSVGGKASTLATALQRRDAGDILKDDNEIWKPPTFDAGQVHKILTELKSKEMLVIQTLPQDISLENYLKSETILIAPYTKAHYVVMKHSKRFGTLADTFADYPFTSIRTPNRYMDGVTSVPPQYGTIQKQLIKLPNVPFLKMTSAVHLGSNETLYQGACVLNFLTPYATYNARNFALSLLWTTSVFLSMMKDGSQASFSGLMYAAVPHSYGISIGVAGFPEKIMDLFGVLTDHFYSTEISLMQLTAAKEALLTLYDLLFASSTDHMNSELMHFVSCNHSPDVLSDARVYIQESTAFDVNAFITYFKREALLNVMLAGNVPVSCSKKLEEIINRQSYWPLLAIFSNLFRSNKHCVEYKIPVRCGERCVRLKSDLNRGYTTSVTNYFYFGRYDPGQDSKIWNECRRELMAKAFIILRMKQQLGYFVRVSAPEPKKNKPFVICIGVSATASEHTVCELNRRIDEFVVEYGRQLSDFEAKEWYRTYFGETFQSNHPHKYQKLGMTKISIQVVGNESLACLCEACRSIKGWKRNHFWRHFEFAEGDGEYQEYFVDNPKDLRDGKKS